MSSDRDADRRAALLEMRGVRKAFGPVTVLHGVDLTVTRGSVHGLLGQNGAGKSTLMKILGGVHADYEGTVKIEGQPAQLGSPRRALEAGVGMIYQELSLVPQLTVAENIVLGLEPGRVRYSARRVRALAGAALERTGIGLNVGLDEPVGRLSAGVQQRIEIAKALSRDARILVMDEPTARLSAPERRELFAFVAELAAAGTGIVFITHFLDEVLQVTDEITVLRNGRVVANGPTRGFDVGALTLAMLDEELAREERAERDDPVPGGPVVLEAKGLSCLQRLQDATLSVRRGEIVGIAGLVGSGRTRLARVLAGADRPTGGSIVLNGRPLRLRSPRDAVRAGIVLVPEDRKASGVVATQSGAMNLTLTALDHDLSRFGFVRRRAQRRAAEEQFAQLEVRPANPRLVASAYSGGNQQKLLLGRALLARPAVLIADQPTAGVDVGTKAQIHEILRRVAGEGTAIVVISDDIEELLALSDRIVLMRHGRTVDSALRNELDAHALVERMSRTTTLQPA